MTLPTPASRTTIHPLINRLKHTRKLYTFPHTSCSTTHPFCIITTTISILYTFCETDNRHTISTTTSTLTRFNPTTNVHTMSPIGSTSSLSPVSLLQQNRPSAVTPLASRPASPRHEDLPNPLENHELHCHQARGGMYAAQLKRARSQTPSIRSSSRLDREYFCLESPAPD